MNTLHYRLAALAALLLTLALAGCGAFPSAAQPTATPVPKPAPTLAPAPTIAAAPKPAATGAIAAPPAAAKSAPPMTIDTNKIYVATLDTDKGKIVMELYPADAPQHVNNFVALANSGFYNGLTFHRVEPGFVIQGGDPEGSGRGGPGYTIPAEIKRKHPEGAVAAARTGDQVNPQRASSGSQFYITLAATPQLDGAYTSYGQVVEGMDVAKKIQRGDKIKSVTITTK